MSFEIHCLSCDVKLALPEDKLGKKVRCPRCKTEFTAREEVEGELVEEAPEPVSMARSSGRRPELEEDDDEEIPRRRRRRKRRATNINGLVNPPAAALKIVAYVGAVINVVGVIIHVARALIAAGEGSLVADDLKRGIFALSPMWRVIVCIGTLAITAVWSGFLIKGSNCIYSLKSYEMGFAACVVAMLPFAIAFFDLLPLRIRGLGWVFPSGGLAVGIWGMVILCLKDVRDAFS